MLFDFFKPSEAYIYANDIVNISEYIKFRFKNSFKINTYPKYKDRCKKFTALYVKKCTANCK